MNKLLMYANLLSTFFWLCISVYDPTLLGSLFIFLGTILTVDGYYTNLENKHYLDILLNDIDNKINLRDNK